MQRQTKTFSAAVAPMNYKRVRTTENDKGATSKLGSGWYGLDGGSGPVDPDEGSRRATRMETEHFHAFGRRGFERLL